ncbi:DNA-directed RNA polymerase subunit alpha C-terminal domain-containing protein [Mesorhizobium newzealandense]|uniref:DNA-directed RNA polymerase subunit alpha C-terminal domain-containing protein n=1 Tax=Mesorhizobium newzealandense TaxID=1300302 RepID=A0ABW4UFU6_9HYPH
MVRRKKIKKRKFLSMTIDELDLSFVSYNCLNVCR